MPSLSNKVRGGLIAAGWLALCAPLLGAAPANAASPPSKPSDPNHPRSCFFVNQWRGWKSPTPDVIYLAVNLHDVYKVQLSTPSPELQWPDVHLISQVRGSDSICDALDLDLTIVDTGGGFREPLIAIGLTKLTPEEVAAIPPKFRPY
jgi:hypothetical protein